MCINIIQFLCIMPPAKTNGKDYIQFRLPVETYKRLQIISVSFDLKTYETVSFLLDALHVPPVAEFDNMINKAEIEKLAKQFYANLMIDSAMSREENRTRYLRDSAFAAYESTAAGMTQDTPEQKKD